MTVSSISGRFGLAKVAGVCTLAVGLLLGGCNKQIKDDNAALTAQNSALIAENNQLKANQDAMNARLTQLEAERAQPAAQGPMGGYDDEPRSRSGGAARSETIVIAGDVLFDSGQATLKSTAKKELDTVASRLRSRHSGADIRVEGYTDTDPIKKSKWGSNDALSEARAEAVRNYLVSKGISSSRISAVGMGSSKPKATKKDSRRVEIVVVE